MIKPVYQQKFRLSHKNRNLQEALQRSISLQISRKVSLMIIALHNQKEPDQLPGALLLLKRQ